MLPGRTDAHLSAVLGPGLAAPPRHTRSGPGFWSSSPLGPSLRLDWLPEGERYKELGVFGEAGGVGWKESGLGILPPDDLSASW